MKTIILAGSGHAHLEILKALTKEETASNRFLLISPSPVTYYSGLIPRLIMGDVATPALTIESARYASAKGVQFIQDSIRSFDPIAKEVTLESGRIEKFDILSLNTGATPQEVPTLSPFNTIYLKPFATFIEKWREVQRICSACTNPRFVVVGGGAAAVEVATALRVRLDRNQARRSEIHLVTKSSRLCESYAEKISATIHRSLLNNRIEVHLDQPVSSIEGKFIVLKSGKPLKFDSIFMATPNVATPARTVDAYLRLSPDIFAAGDSANLEGYPELPKSGVIAVHQGRYLAESLRKMLRGESPDPFRPASHQLSILVSSAQSARLVWGEWSVEGKAALRLKNFIDQRYMNSFRL